MFGEKDIALSIDCSQKDIVSSINSLFKHHWIRGNSYIKQNPELMRSKKLSGLIKERETVNILGYINTLVNSIERNHFKELNDIHPLIGNELSHWDEEGGLCIYISVLTYGLLTRTNTIPKSNINYYQGYYDFKLREDFPPFIPFPERQLGLHAWLTVNGSLLDLTANQNKTVFDFQFDKINMILGEFPSGYNLYGFKESEETIEAYYKLFNEWCGLTIEEWFDLHTNAMNELLKQSL